MAYPIPPWIKAPEDPAQAYVSAFHAGAAVAGEQARLQMEAHQQATHLAVQQQQMQMANMRQQQELEMQKALHEATIGIRQQQLAQAQEKIQFTAQNAARKYAAQQKYDQLVGGGMAPDQAALQVGPELFGSMAGFGSTAKEFYERTHPFQATDYTTPGGVKGVYVSPNRFAPSAVTPESSPLEMQPIIDPTTGKPVPGAGAYPTKQGMRPYTYPKPVDPNKEELKELKKANVLFSQYASGALPLPEKMSDRQKKAYEAFKQKYDSLTNPNAQPGAPGAAPPPMNPPSSAAPDSKNPILRIVAIRPAGSKAAPAAPATAAPAAAVQSPVAQETEAPQRVWGEPAHTMTGSDIEGLNSLNRRQLSKLSGPSLANTAQFLGVKARYNAQTGKIETWKEGDDWTKAKPVDRSEFENRILKAAEEKDFRIQIGE